MSSEFQKSGVFPFNKGGFFLTPSQSLLCLVIGALLIRLLSLGVYPLMDTTEARYAEIARIMVEKNDWITPWFDYGVPFWGKPPLSFWLTAVSFKLLGVNEFAARLPHFLCAFLVACLVWNLGVRNSYKNSLYAIALLSGSALYFISAGAVMTDMVLVLGTTLSMRGFWLALHPDKPSDTKEKWLFFIGIGIALLAKGPIGFLLTIIPLTIWVLLRKKVKKTLNSFSWTGGLLLTLLITLPWYILAEIRTPGFLTYFFIGEHWDRYFIPGWKGDLYGSGHYYPRGTVWLFFLIDLLPWSLLIPIYRIWFHRENRDETETENEKDWNLYLLLWSLTPAVFFTFAKNILWPYVLPGLPALALYTSNWLVHCKDVKGAEKLLMHGLLLTQILSILFAASPLVQARVENKSAKSIISEYEKYQSSNDKLFFLGKRSFSADFYSKGKVEFIPDIKSLKQRLQHDRGFVVIKSKVKKTDLTSLEENLSYISQQGGYILYKTKITK